MSFNCPIDDSTFWIMNCDNNGGDRPTQLLSTCNSHFRVWLERVYVLGICPFCTKQLGVLEYLVKSWSLLD